MSYVSEMITSFQTNVNESLEKLNTIQKHLEEQFQLCIFKELLIDFAP